MKILLSLIFILPFILIPLFVFGVFIFLFVKVVSHWAHNNSQPGLSREAKVVTKRTQVSGMELGSSTYFFVTFQFEHGERLGFAVIGTEHGMLCEGDVGTLTYKGVAI
jgi:hypothetical protein